VKILIVLSSVGRIPGTDRKTGTWYEELADPYYAFKDAHADVTLASPEGGPAPLDPIGQSAPAQTAATRRFDADPEAQKALAHTLELSPLSAGDFDALFYPGGLGPVFDLSQHAKSIALIEQAFAVGKPVAAVCHGPAALREARDRGGISIINGRCVTGFSNSEEASVNSDLDLPFKIEDELIRLGGRYERAEDWQPHIAVAENLVTGQNPASSVAVARQVLALIASARR
jgi:putative intracellular protease/amidase